MHDGVFENKGKIEMDNADLKEHIELLSSYEPYTCCDIFVTQLQIKSEIKVPAELLMSVLSKTIESEELRGIRETIGISNDSNVLSE